MKALNLLPPERRALIRRVKELSRWQAAAWSLTVFSIIGAGGLVVLDRFMQNEVSTVSTEFHQRLAATDQTELGTIRRNIEEFNQTSALLHQSLPGTTGWAVDLVELLNTLPTGITLQSTILRADGSLTLTGTAAARADFLALDEKLKGSPWLKNVATTSTPSKREDLPFVYTAILSVTRP